MNGLSAKQKAFVHNYIQTGNKVQSYMDAGYTQNYNSAAVNSIQLLSNPKIQAEIAKMREMMDVANSAEVMKFFSSVMRGEVKDQFGLETSVADRIKAAQELAKRTVDLESRLRGNEEASITIKLDWDRKS